MFCDQLLLMFQGIDTSQKSTDESAKEGIDFVIRQSRIHRTDSWPTQGLMQFPARMKLRCGISVRRSDLIRKYLTDLEISRLGDGIRRTLSSLEKSRSIIFSRKMSDSFSKVWGGSGGEKRKGKIEHAHAAPTSLFTKASQDAHFVRELVLNAQEMNQRFRTAPKALLLGLDLKV